MTVTQDGDEEGCLRLFRLPSPQEAVVIRDVTGLRKRVDYAPDALERKRASMAKAGLARGAAGASVPVLPCPTRSRRSEVPRAPKAELADRSAAQRLPPANVADGTSALTDLRSRSVETPRCRTGGVHVDLRRSSYRPIGDLIPYAKNARTHDEAHVAEIAASIRAFGWTNPILVDGENGVIAGHGRLLAARKLGMATVPVIELAGLSEAEKRAYILADNKLALNAGWDTEMLALETRRPRRARLRPVADRLRRRGDRGPPQRGNPGLTDPDDDPGGPGDAGDACRAMSGFSAGIGWSAATAPAEDVAKALNGVRPHLMVTDPPYGVSYDPAWRESAGLADGGTVAKGKVLNDDRADWREAWALFPGDVAYVWHGALHAATVAQSLEACGFAIRSQIIWDKMRLVIGRGDYHWHHEPMFYAVRKGKTGHWAGGRNQTTVWQIPHRRNAIRPRHREAGRVHEAADREQLLARPGGVRAVLGLRHHHHRRRDHRPVLPCDRAEPGLCRCRHPPLAGVYRGDRSPRRQRPCPSRKWQRNGA